MHNNFLDEPQVEQKHENLQHVEDISKNNLSKHLDDHEDAHFDHHVRSVIDEDANMMRTNADSFGDRDGHSYSDFIAHYRGNLDVAGTEWSKYKKHHKTSKSVIKAIAKKGRKKKKQIPFDTNLHSIKRPLLSI